MTNMLIQAGDVVKLKSGGPTMTVESLDGDSAFCAWFTDSGTVVRDSFKQPMLKRIEPATPAASFGFPVA